MNMPNKRELDFIGFVDTYEKGAISGWKYSPTPDNKSILLRINQTIVKEVAAKNARPDVSTVGIPDALCGFNFNIKLTDLPSEGCTISILDKHSKLPLQNGIFSFKDGILDLITPGESPLHKNIAINTYLMTQEIGGNEGDPMAVVQEILPKLRNLPKNTFVAMAYLLILGRIPDPDGFRTSLQSILVTDEHKKMFLYRVMGSVEFKKKRSFSAVRNDLSGIKFTS